MLTLEELVNIEIIQEKKILRKYIDVDKEHLTRSLAQKNNLFGINSLVKGNLINAKQYFFNSALLDEYRINNFHDRMLDYAIPQMNYALLSDNWSYLESVYSKLRYNTYYIGGKTNEKKPITMDEMVLQGESAIWCNTIQFFMVKDFASVERNLNILKTLTLPKLPKNQQELKIDFEFYQALLNKDKDKCEEVLELLVSSKVHNKRNDNPLLRKYISQPALGYAKLAWRLGVEVEFNNSLVPIEILPIEPLVNYKIPYDFLKEKSA